MHTLIHTHVHISHTFTFHLSLSHTHTHPFMPVLILMHTPCIKTSKVYGIEFSVVGTPASILLPNKKEEKKNGNQEKRKRLVQMT